MSDHSIQSADENVNRLRRLDACALSDALDRLQIRGGVTGFAQQSGDRAIAGRAITVKLALGPPPAGPPRHLGTTAIEASGPDNIIVVEQRTGVEAGCWGGLLTLGAKTRGVTGVIADGPVRDIDEARGYNFPIFSNALTALTARGRVSEFGTNVPVSIGSVQVEAGDYVFADRSALIFIKPDHISAVLEAAEIISGREKAMAKAIAAGKPISAVMGGDYEFMLEQKS